MSKINTQYHRLASIAPWTRLLRKSWTACLDMKEERDKKSGLICVRWDAFLEVASDLVRDAHSKQSKQKSVAYLVRFLAWRGWIDCPLTLTWHGYSEQRRDWRQSFRLLPRGRGVMARLAIMVGSFTLQLHTFAPVATLLAFAKLWRYCMFGGDFFTLGGFERREVN